MALRMKMNIPQRASERKRKRKKPSQVNSNSRVLVPPFPFLFHAALLQQQRSTFCSICRFSTYVCIHQKKNEDNVETKVESCTGFGRHSSLFSSLLPGSLSRALVAFRKCDEFHRQSLNVFNEYLVLYYYYDTL